VTPDRVAEAPRPSYERLWSALVEIDTYLANDPQVWRIVSVCKAGEVLCDVLGAEVIGSINASIEALLCPSCHQPHTWCSYCGSKDHMLARCPDYNAPTRDDLAEDGEPEP
jgi:hypothetical protein